MITPSFNNSFYSANRITQPAYYHTNYTNNTQFGYLNHLFSNNVAVYNLVNYLAQLIDTGYYSPAIQQPMSNRSNTSTAFINQPHYLQSSLGYYNPSLTQRPQLSYFGQQFSAIPFNALEAVSNNQSVIQPALANDPNQKVVNIFLLGGQSNAVPMQNGILEKAVEAQFGQDTEMRKNEVFTYAAGGTNLHTQWKADGTDSSNQDGPLYQTFQSNLTTYLEKVQQANPDAKINIVGMFWMQGESDGLSSKANADDYDDNLARFIQDVRAFVNDPTMPFVIGRLGDAQKTVRYLAEIQAAQDSVAQADPFSDVANLDGIAAADNIHFRGQYDEVAKRFVQSMNTLLR